MRTANVLVSLVILVIAVASCGYRDNPVNCQSDSECGAGRCNLTTYRCESVVDGGADADSGDGPQDVAEDADATDAVDVITEVDSGCANDDQCGAPTPACLASAATCVECTNAAVHCTSNPAKAFCVANACVGCQTAGAAACTGATPACDTSSGKCVECNTSSDCTTAKPICNTATHSCGTCTSDSQCAAKAADPGVCMADGHCAAPSEAVYVEYSSSGCAGADGTLAKPYCTFATGVPALSATRNLLVLRGPASDQLALAPSFAVTVVGQPNAGDEAASISASGATGVTITSGSVLVRDLKVYGGGSASGRGVSVSGAATAASLLRVTVTGNQGVGVEAKTGASVTMNRCVVQNNAAGGVLNNGAKTAITNSALIANSYGIQLYSPVSSEFTYNTVVANSGNATICDPNTPPTLSYSIVVGTNANCTISNSVTTAPTFSGGYHLTAHLPCPGGDAATYPPDDIDGQTRTPPLDCGADQYVP